MFDHVETDWGDNTLPRKTIDGMRFYEVREGVLLPSVTTALKGLSEDAIAEWREKVGEEEADRISAKASTQGNIVHELAEQYVNNLEPDTHNVSMFHLEMFNALKPFLKANVGKVFGTEQRLYSETLGVAGTADLLAEWDGIPSVIDYKTSNKPKKKEWIHGYLQQSACYSFMAYERAKIHLPQIVILMVTNDAEVQVFVERARDWLNPAIETITAFNEKIADM